MTNFNFAWLKREGGAKRIVHSVIISIVGLLEGGYLSLHMTILLDIGSTGLMRGWF